MTSAPDTSLTWSAKYSIDASSNRTAKLPGDKILLPPSALEQLIAAAPVVSSDAESRAHTSDFDPLSPYTFAAERFARAAYQDRQPQLPHPLTFRLVNPDNGRIIYAGIREFSADDGTVVLSRYLRDRLGYSNATERGDVHMTNGVDEPEDTSEKVETLTISAHQLPKGTYVKLRPLEAGYDVDDWKALLEQHLRSNFTTLTNGDELVVPVPNSRGRKEEFRFLVDGFKPESDAVCIVDTDLEVDIEALDEEQARETLKRIAAKLHKATGSAEGSSAGGILPYMQTVNGQVLEGEYVDYDLTSWDRSQGLDIELVPNDDDDELDLFVSPFSTRQRARPREDEHVFEEMSSTYPKTVKIRSTNIELENADSLRISVLAYSTEPLGSNDSASPPKGFTLRASPAVIQNGSNGIRTAHEETPHEPDDVKCDNCHRWVPKGSLFLHQNFCLRNNVVCPKGCGQVFQKRSAEWTAHWHCPHDSSYGNTPLSKTKHDFRYHAPTICPSCSMQFATIPELAHHRVTECSGKLILCQFCHLEVPQEGDPTQPPDLEVLISGLTPHEVADGGRTTECHLCNKIVRLRDMSTHMRNHDFERSSRPEPRMCRNVLCGRTLDGANKSGDTRSGTRQGQGPGNEMGLCSICYGPLYAGMHDPEGKALRRRVERRYLSQLMTGCGKSWCHSQFCRTGKKNQTGEDKSLSMKDGVPLVKPYLEGLIGGNWSTPLHFCVDESSQKRRVMAEMISVEPGVDGKGGYAEEWCVAALEAESGSLDGARTWLKNWAPKRNEKLLHVNGDQ